jgi:site-specific recombinase XerC
MIVSMWTKRWGYEMSPKASRPGIWRLKDGGFYVRGRVTHPRTGDRKEVQRALPDANLQEAQRTLDALKASARELLLGRQSSQTLFAAFAALLFKRKVIAGDIKSAKSRERWETTLRLHLIPELGDFACDEIRYADLAAFRHELAVKISAPDRIPHPDEERSKTGDTVRNPGHLDPTTANGFLSILRVVCRAMTAELELPKNPAEGLRNFDESTHPTYTDEQPNALTPEQAAEFLACMKERWPQHYAMTLLGFVTGWRPSSLRPLRRRGPEADILWDEGAILIRRSNTMRQEVMNTTKTKHRQKIHLPKEVMQALKEHVAAFDDGPQEESDLLFPARHGGMRTKSVLDKPFADVCNTLGFSIHLTPRGMRRTFNDLTRTAKVHDFVTRSISGHQTETMQEGYSTVAAEEQRKGIGKVIHLVKGGKLGGNGPIAVDDETQKAYRINSLRE